MRYMEEDPAVDACILQGIYFRSVDSGHIDDTRGLPTLARLHQGPNCSRQHKQHRAEISLTRLHQLADSSAPLVLAGSRRVCLYLTVHTVRTDNGQWQRRLLLPRP